jgi:hypothetical protein
MGKRHIQLALLAGAIAMLSLLTSGQRAGAVTYDVETSYTLSCDVDGDGDVSCTGNARDPGKTADSLHQFDIPPFVSSRPHSNAAAVIATAAPSAFWVALDSQLPDGAYVGTISAYTTLSVLSAPCPSSPNITVNIALFDCSTDNSVHNLVDWVGDGTNQTLDTDGNGLPQGCDQYPRFIDQQLNGVRPRARYFGYGYPISSGSLTFINFVIFGPEQVSQIPGPPEDMGDAPGYTNFVFLNNPSAPATPNSVAEFCAPLGTDIGAFGKTQGEGEGIPPAGAAPEMSIHCAGLGAGVDNDGDTVADDGCFIVTDQCGDSTDNDGDTLTDELCDLLRARNPLSATSGLGGTGSHLTYVYSQGNRDADGDTIPNGEDECPRQDDTGADGDGDGIDNVCDPLSNPGDTDQDDDGLMNLQDNCPLIDDRETGAQCGTDTTDDDADTYVNDGCPILDAPAEDPITECNNATDDDSDGEVNDGCTVIGEPDNDIAAPGPAPDQGTLGDSIGDACDTGTIEAEGAAEWACNDNVDDDLDSEADDGCPLIATFPNGPYLKVMPAGSVCIGAAGTDNDGDGWCNDTETALGSDPNNAGSKPESYSIDYPIDLAPQTCSDFDYYRYPAGAGPVAIDNDGDTLANAGDAGCSCPAGDADCDGVPDVLDNCLATPNPGQRNTDGDSPGDACDADDDADNSAAGPFDNSDVGEWAAGTDPRDPCSGRGHRFDMNSNGTINVADVMAFVPVLGKNCRDALMPAEGAQRRVRVWSVDFKGKPDEAAGNHEVVRDRQGLPPQHIRSHDSTLSKAECEAAGYTWDPLAGKCILPGYQDQCGNEDGVEWRDCQPAFPDGVREKDWPVAYVKGSQVVLKEVRFKVVRAQGAPAFTDVTVVGTPQWPGDELREFKAEHVNQVGDELVIQNVPSTGSLHSWVDWMDNSQKMRIKWTVTQGANIYDAGMSDHTVYVIFKAPRAGYEDKTYLTLVNYTTHQAVYQTQESGVVEKVWSEFRDWQVQTRILDPASGAITLDATNMVYWNEVGVDKTLQWLFENLGAVFTCPQYFGTEVLLRTQQGRCGAWADFLQHSLAIHGIQADRVRLVIAWGGADCPDKEDCIFLVKNWEFAAAGGTSGDAEYPFTWAEVTDRNGVPAQGVIQNPPPFFWDHAIARVAGKLYDPSYGLPDANEGYADLATYDDASIAGFCKPSGAAFFCQRNTAGPPSRLVEDP